MKALIVGGGIGGLASAIALAQRGHAVSVLEQAPELSEIGAGLQIAPNGWRVLDALGVTSLLRDTLFEPEKIEMRMGRSGIRIFGLQMRGYAERRWRAPYIHIHRADLVDALAIRLSSLAPDALRTGVTVKGYRQDRGQSALLLDGGETLSADVVIGADGLHSVIRAQMLGPDAPRYTGNVAWRAVVPVENLGDHAPPPGACIWAGDKRHAVTTRLRAGTLANFVGMVEEPEPSPEGWRVEGHKADARAAFAGWHPVVTTVIEQAPVLNRWALFDRAPLPRWHEGRVGLLGDAAHPMLPSMAQGAVQALEDAWILAVALDTHDEPEAAFKRYFDLRIARTARVQKGSAANARLFHQGGPLRRAAIYGPIALGARILPGLIHARQDWVYGYDATTVI
ncbi:FAD-dependent monooxygenase [uncultured Tateyamaria sp.]|uniref:FAD-dependent monooxygenase n=1 Tax=uncultured Tateyamaria sp. TaxID=455651 RepID=UPI002631CDA8|nr:FAD-dependent monooxygenase [uncultured Tateyamaria sp.]